MIIPLGNKVRAEVVDSVLGQLSDGIWENSGRMDKYWKFADVDGTNLDISDETYDNSYSYYHNPVRNGFYGKSEKEIKDWFANKAKQVVKIWADDEGLDPKEVWDRNNTDVVTYMGHSYGVKEITVADVYECYDFLKGRSGKKYGKVAEEPVEELIDDEPYEVLDDVEPQVSGGMNPSQQDLEDFFTGASTRVRRNRGYVRASDDITAYGKCIGYGIDYRNMHNALHGILVYSDRSEAEDLYDDLIQAKRAREEYEYDNAVEIAFNCAIDDIEDIDRDFIETDSDKIYPVHDDEFIIIVNRAVINLFLK